MTKRQIEYWVIPPDGDAEFAANMEEVLETYYPGPNNTHEFGQDVCKAPLA